MKTYPKIETLYNRDNDFKVTVGDYRRPEFGLVKSWVVQEKIDGTNIRLIFVPPSENDTEGTIAIKGKTDNAQIPPELLANLGVLTQSIKAEVAKICEEHGLPSLTLYGEGYGAKIQSGGYYRPDQGFILFDVLAGDMWLDWRRVMDTSTRLGVGLVPHLGGMDEEAILDLVLGNYESLEAQEKRAAEGVIARPDYNLYDQRGERIMWKLKGRDFARGR